MSQIKYRPVGECFEFSDQVKAKHNLYNAFFEQERKDISKFQFYVWLHQTYGGTNAVDKDGDLGYNLKFKEKSDKQAIPPTPPSKENHENFCSGKCEKLSNCSNCSNIQA